MSNSLIANPIKKNAKYLTNHEFKDIQQLNKFNGDVTEGVMSSYFKNSGWGQIDGEIGVNGIDGLFIKKDRQGNIKDVMFVESKYNKSQLGYMDKNNPHLKSRQMSKRSIEKQIDNLIKNTKNKEKLQDYLNIKKSIQSDSYRARLFKMKPLGDNKFKITIDALEQKEYKDITKKTIKGSQKYKAHNLIIDLKKQYKKGSYESKLQSHVKTSIKNTKASHKIKRAYNSSKNTSKLFKKAVPTIFIQKANKVLTFMDAKAFKNVSKLNNMKFLKNVKGGDVLMMTLEGGIAVYTVLHGGMTYSKASKLLMSNSKTLASQGFSKGFAILTPPPASLVLITSIAGAMITEYAIDKYIELEKRNYVGLEDMLWDVPEEIKKKITILNLEDTKKETIFDFDEIDKVTSLDEDLEGESVFEKNTDEEKTSLDY